MFKLSLMAFRKLHIMYHINNITCTSKNSRTALVYLELMAKYLPPHKYQILAPMLQDPSCNNSKYPWETFLHIKECCLLSCQGSRGFVHTKRETYSDCNKVTEHCNRCCCINKGDSQRETRPSKMEVYRRGLKNFGAKAVGTWNYFLLGNLCKPVPNVFVQIVFVQMYKCTTVQDE